MSIRENEPVELKFRVNNAELIKRVTDKLGKTSMFMSIEELAELQKEVTKMERGIGNTENVAEEICDVVVAISWIMARYDISVDQVNEFLDVKNMRISKNLNK